MICHIRRGGAADIQAENTDRGLTHNVDYLHAKRFDLLLAIVPWQMSQRFMEILAQQLHGCDLVKTAIQLAYVRGIYFGDPVKSRIASCALQDGLGRVEITESLLRATHEFDRALGKRIT